MHKPRFLVPAVLMIAFFTITWYSTPLHADQVEYQMSWTAGNDIDLWPKIPGLVDITPGSSYEVYSNGNITWARIHVTVNHQVVVELYHNGAHHRGNMSPSRSELRTTLNTSPPKAVLFWALIVPPPPPPPPTNIAPGQLSTPVPPGQLSTPVPPSQFGTPVPPSQFGITPMVFFDPRLGWVVIFYDYQRGQWVLLPYGGYQQGSWQRNH